MHRTLLLLAFLPFTSQALDPSYQYLTPTELQGFGDFDGDAQLEAVVIDRATGLYRRALPQADGSLLFTAPTPTGLTSADTFSVGRLTSNLNDQLLVGGLQANRSHLLSPASATSQPLPLFTSGIGHRSLAAIDIALPSNTPSLLDIVLLTGSADEPATQAIFQTSSSIATLHTESVNPAPPRRILRVKASSNGPDYLLAFQPNASPDTEDILLSDPQAIEAPPADSLFGLPLGSDLIHGPFRGGPNHQFLFFVPGSPLLRLVNTLPGSLLQNPVTQDLGAPIESLHHAHDGTALGFFVIFDGGQTGTFFTLDSSGTAVPGQSLAAPAGQRLTGLIAPVPGHLTTLAGAASGGPSTHASHYAHDGSSWQLRGTQSLAPVGSSVALRNVFLFQGEPLANPDAALTQTLRIPDWTSALSLSLGSVTVTRETAATTGLTNPLPVTTPGIATATTHGLTNQFLPQVAVSGVTSALGPTAPQVSIAPPPGEYARHFRVELDCPDITADIHYRIGTSGPWTLAGRSRPVFISTPNLGLTAFTIEYFGEKNGVRSPIQSATYRYADPAGSIDSDHDGVPDFVERHLGLDPLSGADYDQDGFSDLRELLAGTDPASTSSFPGSLPTLNQQNVFNLALRPLSFHSTATTTATRPCYAESTDPEDPPATGVRVHDLSARLLQSTITRDNPEDALTGPTAFLSGLPATDRDLFLIASTDATFAVRPDPTVLIADPTIKPEDDLGIELLALVPVPHLALAPVPWLHQSSDSPAASANSWISTAQAHYAAQTRHQIEKNFNWRDTLQLLLTERLLALLLAQRDPAFDPNSFSLTPFRDRQPAPPFAVETLLALQDGTAPGSSAHLLHDLFESVATAFDAPSPALSHLATLTRELYLSAGTLTAESPGLYPSPVDTLRAFLRGQPLPGTATEGYAAQITLSPAQLSAAASSPTELLAALTARPIATFHARVTATTFDQPVPVLRQVSTNTALRLYTASASPFAFPPGLQLPVGTELIITAYNDRTTPPFAPGTDVEVITASLLRFPAPTEVDPAQLYSSTLYATGRQVPGEPAGTVFTRFGPPVLDDTRIGFLASVRPAGTRRSSLVLFGGDPAAVLLRLGDLAPGTNAASFASFQDPLYIDGQLTIQATLKTGTGNPRTTAASNAGLWSGLGGSLDLIAREGSPAPGAGGALFSTFSALAASPSSVVFTATLRGTGVRAANNSGLWRHRPGITELILRKGDAFQITPSDVRNVSLIQALPATVAYSPDQARAFAADGAFRCLVSFTDRSSAVLVFPLAAPAYIETLLGDPVAALNGATLVKIGTPASGTSGSAFLASLTRNGTSITRGTDSALLLASDTALTPIARTGDTAADTGGALYRSLWDPILSGPDTVTFLASLQPGTGNPRVTAASDIGLWTATPTGSLRLIAREGDAAPGVANATSSARFSRFLAIGTDPHQSDPAQRRTAFLARLANTRGLVTATSNTGLWTAHPSGEVSLLLRTGTFLPIGRQNLPVRTLQALRTSRGTPGAGRTTRHPDRLTYLATFPGSNQAIIQSLLPEL
jgi:hypothetical protein